MVVALPRREQPDPRREIARNGGRAAYRAQAADVAASERARRPKVSLLAARPVLRARVEAGLALEWSPQQISRRLVLDFPDDESMRVSHETIYLSIFQPVRKALPPRLHRHLRTGRLMRLPLVARQPSGRGRIKDMVPIQRRPPSIEERRVGGHWEGDLVMGRRPSAVATLVERRTRYLRLVALPKGLKAVHVRRALVADLNQVPHWQRRSLTWDRGREMADHARFTRDTGCRVYFCDPAARGSGARTRTRTGCCASTCPSPVTSTATTKPRSTRSPNGSTTGPGPCLAGAPRPRRSPQCSGTTAGTTGVSRKGSLTGTTSAHMSEVTTSIRYMSQCTAPVRGHIRGGGADCPVHGRGGGYGYASARPYPTYTAPAAPVRRSGAPSSSGGGGGQRTARPAWQPRSSTASYTQEQVRNLEPVRAATVARTQGYDVFLCHAWPDRQAAAKDLHDFLIETAVSVWFSEVSLRPGTDMRVAIERGLVSSRMGIVLVTPAMLEKLRTDRSIANAELSALLRRNLLVPIMHGATFEDLDQVSPILASRGGFSTAEEPMKDIVVKIAELAGELTEEEAAELSLKSTAE